MSSSPSAISKKTPLHAKHRALEARMVEFGGWEMPIEYSGITSEHLAVRTRVGIFDVSHMGQIELAGADALSAVQWLTTNDAEPLSIGQAQYSALTTPRGTFVDDLLVYKLAADHFLLIVNAANTAKDYQWIRSKTLERGGDVAVVNSSARYALIALQGPRAQDVLQSLTDIELESLKYYRFSHGEVAGILATVSRTGYTGEDGFEILVPPTQAGRLWDALLAGGQEAGICPCGLGARDTLRLEAGMRLYGNEMDEDVTVLEAGLGWIIAWRKGEFLGLQRLGEQQAHGVERRLAAFEMVERGIARPGYPVLQGDQTCGVVTSGTQTPFLKKAIGFAMVPMTMAAKGSTLDIGIRGRVAHAHVVAEPFYQRAPKPDVRRAPSATQE